MEAKNADRPAGSSNRANGLRPDQAAKVTLIVVDSRRTIRTCLAAWVSGELPEVSVFEVSDVDELSRRTVPASSAVIVLLSFASGPGRNPKAEQAAWRVRSSFADGRLVFLCDDIDQVNVQAAVRCGAVGFIDTTSGPAVLTHCLRFVIVGGTALPSIGAVPDGGAKRDEAAPEAPSERYPRFSAESCSRRRNSMSCAAWAPASRTRSSPTSSISARRPSRCICAISCRSSAPPTARMRRCWRSTC